MEELKNNIIGGLNRNVKVLNLKGNVEAVDDILSVFFIDASIVASNPQQARTNGLVIVDFSKHKKDFESSFHVKDN